jgi:hypothetical protein
VRYESPTIFLNVYHGRASFELGIEVGRLTDPNKKLSLYDIVAWAGGEEAEGFGQHVSFQVSTRKDVHAFIPKLAAVVKKYASPFLGGDDPAFDSAFEIQSERAKQYANEVNAKNIRSRAEEAWHRKDYETVVELYDSIRKDLTEVESKRIAYAEQRLMTNVGSRSSTLRKH